jgi:hypothetical protein
MDVGAVEKDEISPLLPKGMQEVRNGVSAFCPQCVDGWPFGPWPQVLAWEINKDHPPPADDPLLNGNIEGDCPFCGNHFVRPFIETRVFRCKECDR